MDMTFRNKTFRRKTFYRQDISKIGNVIDRAFRKK